MIKTKDQIYEEHFKIPFVDGTADDLYEVYTNHPQIDIEVLEKACETMGDFVWLSMNICPYYWNDKQGEYKQLLGDDAVDYDLTKWKIEFINTNSNGYDPLVVTHEDFKEDGHLFNFEYVNERKVLGWIVNEDSYEKIFKQLLDGGEKVYV